LKEIKNDIDKKEYVNDNAKDEMAAA